MESSEKASNSANLKFRDSEKFNIYANNTNNSTLK
jgi:hypothetical protein